MVWPAIIGAAAAIGGGLLSKSATDQANDANARNASNNIALQKEFAQHGIQWKVEDAKRAGVHPLYALGASTHSFSPVSVGATPNTSLGTAISSMGQDLSRAAMSTRTAADRTKVVDSAGVALSLERGKLENDLLKLQIQSQAAKLRADQVGPPMPAAFDAFNIPGQSSSGVKSKALEVAPAEGTRPHQEMGPITDIGHSRSSSGWVPVPSKDVKERIEDNMPHEWRHFLVNNVGPIFGHGKPPFPAPPGQSWRYSPFKLEWQLRKQITRDELQKWKGY